MKSHSSTRHPFKTILLTCVIASSIFGASAAQAACRSSLTTPLLVTFNIKSMVVSNSTPIGETMKTYAASGSNYKIGSCDASSALIAHTNTAAPTNPQIIPTNIPGIGIRVSFKSKAQNAEGVYPFSHTMTFPSANSLFIDDDSISLSFVRTGNINPGTLNAVNLGRTTAAGVVLRTLQFKGGTPVTVSATNSFNSIETMESENNLPSFGGVADNPFAQN